MKLWCYFFGHNFELTHQGAADYLNGFNDCLEHVCVRCDEERYKSYES